MSRIERKIRKLIEDGDKAEKNRSWQRFVRKHIGCQCCQHYNKKKKLCKMGHQDILEERHRLPCEDILPTKLK